MITEFELLAPKREMMVTPRVITPVAGIDVVDEAGFAYLSGDIDFGATGRNEIFQNIRFIVLTEFFSVPLDREFGFDYSLVDKPMAIAEAIFSQEVAMKITLYEQRAQFREISYVRDEMIGKLSPTVNVVIISTDEIPSLYRVTIGAEPIAPETRATIAAADAFSGKITGLQGRPGDAGSIIVGQTITGEPGEPALVVNVGTPSIAVLDFTIPEGLKGESGKGIVIKGTVADYDALPDSGQTEGDMWITADTGHGWSWNGSTWIDIGPIKGDKGETGDTGATGQQGPTGQTGETGPPGQIWRGAWNSTTTYNLNDAVEYLGSTYICTGPNVNEPPPVAGSASFWTPPIATTASRGSVPPLSPSAQQSYYLRGDNFWVPFDTLPFVRSDIPPPSGTIVQSRVYGIHVGGSTGAIANVYDFRVSQGTSYIGNFSFTPKYANSIIRASFSIDAQITSAAGWFGAALFKNPDVTAFAEAWSWTGTVNAGGVLAANGYFVLTSDAAFTMQFRIAVGQSAVITSRSKSAIFVDEIKQ